jgi:hypothetical protein
MARKQSTLGSTLTALQQAEAQVEALRKKVGKERSGRLKTLHLSFGFESRDELIDALSALGGSRRPGRPPAAAASAAKSSAPAARKKRKRARITAEMKAEIIKAIKEGGSGLTVAKRFSISSQSVQNIKKAAGLVQARKKSK